MDREYDIIRIDGISQLDLRRFFDIYEESTRENAGELFPDDDIAAAVNKVEADFEEFLHEFFSKGGNTYWILEEDGCWASALRLNLIEDGFYYLEALETRPDRRMRGCASQLINAVVEELKKQGPFRICDCVNKRNIPSVRTHLACGFKIVSEAGRDYLYGGEAEWKYGFEYRYPKGGEMRLIAPSMEYAEQIQAYRREFLLYGGSMDGCGSLRRFDDTRDWLDQVESLKRAETTPEGLVPMTQFIYVREPEKEVAGVIQIRHYFNEYLEKYAGHIGYSVAPSERRRGFATQMLSLVLPECRRLGIKNVLVCCLKDNEGSRRTILHNGGVYESDVYLEEKGVWLERYWIDTGDPDR